MAVIYYLAHQKICAPCCEICNAGVAASPQTHTDRGSHRVQQELRHGPLPHHHSTCTAGSGRRSTRGMRPWNYILLPATVRCRHLGEHSCCNSRNEAARTSLYPRLGLSMTLPSYEPVAMGGMRNGARRTDRLRGHRSLNREPMERPAGRRIHSGWRMRAAQPDACSPRLPTPRYNGLRRRRGPHVDPA